MSVNSVEKCKNISPLKDLNFYRRLSKEEACLMVEESSSFEYKVEEVVEWKSASSSILKVKHKVCGHTYQVAFKNFKDGKRCPHCAIQRKRLLKEDIIAFVEKETQKEYKVLSLEGWTSSRNSKIKFLHKTCGQEYEATFSNFKLGKRCPHCARKSSESKASQLLKRLLESMEVDFSIEKTFKDLRNPFTGGALRYDFFIPELNLLIEIDGEQHFYPVERFGGEKQFRKSKYNDFLKNKYAFTRGFHLIRIPLVEGKKKRVSK